MLLLFIHAYTIWNKTAYIDRGQGVYEDGGCEFDEETCYGVYDILEVSPDI